MQHIPKIGLGTWQSNGVDCYDAVRLAMDLGYEHVDTAARYNNEVQVGKALADSGRSRESFWLTTKIWIDHFGHQPALDSIDQSLKNLQTDYVDLVLIHRPHVAKNFSDHHETLDALMQAKASGQIKNLGVSNFPIAQLEDAIDYTDGQIFTNQCEHHVFLKQEKLKKFMNEHNVLFTAYAPFACGDVFGNQVLEDIANKHTKTVAQIALKWLVRQPDVVTIPKGRSEQHLKNNLDVFDFDLDQEDLEKIEQLPPLRHYDIDRLRPEWD